MSVEDGLERMLGVPATLQPLGELLGESLRRVASVCDEHLRSDVGPVNDLCSHVERYRGKMVRPTLAILSGLAGHPKAGRVPEAELLSDDLIRVAAVCEMVHMATLVHDDVLDGASTRRRGLTVNALHGNEPAVMLGDYLLAAAYHLCSSLADQTVSLAIAHASMVTCSGELLQLHHRGNYALDEHTYFEIIGRKTGELIAVSASLGAKASGSCKVFVRTLELFARDVGLAFQIQDDLLDLTGDKAVVGKTLGLDLAKGKLTLPLIHHLGKADPETRKRTLNLLDEAWTGEAADDHLIGQVVEALAVTESVEYSRRIAADLVERAISRLEGLPVTPALTMLRHVAGGVVSRLY
jgi:octaprenyl-diphosphate synthase